ncbi:uncharacterized protein PpBr36_10651 [Pyricularia pennisetigena]|uniref:uncharacterized protein n=1 Tax=Pyricularia pennisetigena TaxID=1578925 RepID=UPI0011540D99|nr:uncharacterized protein PpBr36_10651 [Pyricularia pennisetigena]TLS21181.1 hypothetical protein PpBr36_10651 [Pyricularia pennisetigena]
MSRCKAFADQAYYAIESNKELRRRYFKTDSLKHVNSIRRAYVQIENACDIKRQNIPFKCKNSEGSCTPRCHAYIHPGKDKVYLCTPFFENNVDGAAKTLIHELSHLDSIRETNDHAYGDDKSKGHSGGGDGSDGGGDGSDGGGDGSDGGGDPYPHITYPPFRGGGDGGTGYGNRDGDGGGDPSPYITYPPFKGGDSWHYG